MKKIYSINFDMDGTITDLYGVDNWLDSLIHEHTKPYREARPLVSMHKLAYLLNKCKTQGIQVNIISCTAKNGSAEYNARVAAAKNRWLKEHLASVEFTHVYIIPYETPKNELKRGNSILFDDESRHRDAWGAGAYDATEIFEVLEGLLSN